jgi:hypothetical protein
VFEKLVGIGFGEKTNISIENNIVTKGQRDKKQLQ